MDSKEVGYTLVGFLLCLMTVVPTIIVVFSPQSPQQIAEQHRQEVIDQMVLDYKKKLLCNRPGERE